MAEMLTEDKVRKIIEDYIGKKLDETVKKFIAHREVYPEELSLIERIIRVEEELKSQRELMKKSFELIEKRFEQIDRRFDQIDKRFEQVDKRFEQVDKRIEELRDYTDKRIKLLTQIVISFNIPVLIGIIGLLIKAFI